jgi:4-amino-4-deoxy-L-arabinose transferase-like glycosyltransferase
MGVLRGLAAPAALFVLAAAILAAGIGSVPLLDPDEPRYAATSRNMLDRGDWVVPWFNGAERVNKPPLFYWLEAASFRFLGASEASARLPSLVAGFLVLALSCAFAAAAGGGARDHRWSGDAPDGGPHGAGDGDHDAPGARPDPRAAALRTGAILLSVPLFLLASKAAITDMTLCLFQTLALLVWYRQDRRRDSPPERSVSTKRPGAPPSHAGAAPAPVPDSRAVLPGPGIQEGNERRRETGAFRQDRLPGAGWLVVPLALGAATLTKGPVGFLVPCLTIGLFSLLRRTATTDRRSHGSWTLGAARLAAAAAVAGAVFLPWTLLLVRRLGGLAPVLEILRRETLERAIGGLDHPRPLAYFLITSLLAFFPWCVFVPFALSASWPAIRRREPLPLFLALWFGVTFVFFSLVRGKLYTYVLPAAPPMAILLALEWPKGASRRGREPGARSPASGTLIGSRLDAPDRPESNRAGAAGPGIGAWRKRRGGSPFSGWTGIGAVVAAALGLLLGAFALLYRG